MNVDLKKFDDAMFLARHSKVRKCFSTATYYSHVLLPCKVPENTVYNKDNV